MTKSDFLVADAGGLVGGKRSVYDGHQGDRVGEITQRHQGVVATRGTGWFESRAL
ncbi:MAG: hypothetical protein ACYCT1_14120 [Steroidobacteraceae bacterium]